MYYNCFEHSLIGFSRFDTHTGNSIVTFIGYCKDSRLRDRALKEWFIVVLTAVDTQTYRTLCGCFYEWLLLNFQNTLRNTFNFKQTSSWRLHELSPTVQRLVRSRILLIMKGNTSFCVRAFHWFTCWTKRTLKLKMFFKNVFWILLPLKNKQTISLAARFCSWIG